MQCTAELLTSHNTRSKKRSVGHALDLISEFTWLFTLLKRAKPSNSREQFAKEPPLPLTQRRRFLPALAPRLRQGL